MNVLIVGSGGREHALAWKIAQSEQLGKLFILPGNPGTHRYGINLAGDPMDADRIIQIIAKQHIDLVVIGPEAPLAAGLADRLQTVGCAVFGPSQQAAEIEASKVYAKNFMQRHRIPTAPFQPFDDPESAIAYVNQLREACVIKVSGLAEGKGVFLPESKHEAEQIIQKIFSDAFGAASSQIVVESRLTGREISVMAFTDGQHILPMIPAHDYKRLLDGDRGLNTGGMGAFAPSPFVNHNLLTVIQNDILQPAIDGLRAEGRPFIGVLYAGLMLTAQGPQVLEFNCRLGDPEAQVVLPLLDGDLLEIILACTTGQLAEFKHNIKWKEASSICVTLASGGYPGNSASGRPIFGVEQLPDEVLVFHSGTREIDGELVTNGGRVMGITVVADTLEQAHRTVYEAISRIYFEDMTFRRDIGAPFQTAATVYAAAGINLDAGNRTLDQIHKAARSTYTSEVLSNSRSFGGMFDASGLTGYRWPVLVSSMDGVGSKALLAARTGRFQGIGYDLVHHCVNDILTQGARPLFFLDYIASERIQSDHLEQIIHGMSQACRACGCVLIGGETAEIPGLLENRAVDIAGAIVGVVEHELLLPKGDIRPGDVLLGLASSGLHTNGFSLLRQSISDIELQRDDPDLGQPLIDILLTPHRSYLPVLYPLVTLPNGPIKALAHITGGGFLDNIQRVMPAGMGFRIDMDSWPVLPIFRLLQDRLRLDQAEMYAVYNMGIGMVAIVSAESINEIQSVITEPTWVIGEVVTEGGGRLA